MELSWKETVNINVSTPPLPPCPSFVFLFKRSIFQLLLWRVEGSQAEEEILFPIFVLREIGGLAGWHVLWCQSVTGRLLTQEHNRGIRGQVGLTLSLARSQWNSYFSDCFNSAVIVSLIS